MTLQALGMWKILKTALVWLVVLAVPAQGFAASTMLFCGPMHERMTSAAGADGSGHHHSAGTNSDHDHHAAVSGQPASAAPADAAADLEKADNLAKFSCSACATCCVGAALVASGSVLPLDNPADERIVSASSPNAGFVTGGPQRPPRSFLA